MRTDNAIKNAKYIVIINIILNFLKFFSRIVFVKILPIDYLGINGLLTNVVAVLSISELGIGTAVAYSLYKPLAVRDLRKIRALLDLLKKAYRYIGITILVLGLAIIPFLDIWVKNNTISDLKYFYIFFLLTDVTGYFFSYKWVLLFADQKQYIYNRYYCIFQTVLISLQMLFLVVTRSYWSFAILMFLVRTIQNYWIYRKTNELYPFILETECSKIDAEDKIRIIKNTKALIINKFANVVNNASINIIASKFIGLAVVGLYSNYYLILSAIDGFTGQLFKSISGSIGNLLAVGEQENKIKVFNIIFFIIGWQASIIFTCFSVGVNDFIYLWVGKQLIMSENTVQLIVILFYIIHMQNGVSLFKETAGLYWEERYRPIVEAILNIILSIYWAKYYGIAGIIMGNIISKLCTSFWVEPYILFKNSIDIKIKEYFIEYCSYFSVTVGTICINKWLYGILFKEVTIINFVLGVFLCLVVSNVVWIALFRNREEMAYLRNVVRDKFGMKFL